MDESQQIEPELLKIILENLILVSLNQSLSYVLQEEEEGADTSARLLAWHLIYRCTEKLQPFITEHLNDILVATEPTEGELREKSHRLIYELNSINPSLLTSILPQLESELKVDNLDVRVEVVQLLANMFSAPDSKLPLNYRQLYSTFLGRFVDINPGIREVMILDFAKDFIKNQTEPKLVQKVQGTDALLVSLIVTEELQNRLLDPVESVRTVAVGCVCECAIAVPEKISLTLLQEVEKRMRDKKVLWVALSS